MLFFGPVYGRVLLKGFLWYSKNPIVPAVLTSMITRMASNQTESDVSGMTTGSETEGAVVDVVGEIGSFEGLSRFTGAL